MMRPAHAPLAPVNLASTVPSMRRPVDQKHQIGFGQFAGALLFLAAAARYRAICHAKKMNYEYVSPEGIAGNDGTEKHRVKMKKKYFRNHPYVDKKIQARWPNMGYRISGAPGFPGSPHAWVEPVRWCIRMRRRISKRKKIEGTFYRPRMAVFTSRKKAYVNIIDDGIGLGQVLLCVSTQQAEVLQAIKEAGTSEQEDPNKAAEILGKIVAKKCLEKDITQIVYDVGGFPYKDRVKALAEGARMEGLQF